jgi:hypothetical protein
MARVRRVVKMIDEYTIASSVGNMGDKNSKQYGQGKDDE